MPRLTDCPRSPSIEAAPVSATFTDAMIGALLTVVVHPRDRERFGIEAACIHMTALACSDAVVQEPLFYAMAAAREFARLPYVLRPRSRRPLDNAARKIVAAERARRGDGA